MPAPPAFSSGRRRGGRAGGSGARLRRHRRRVRCRPGRRPARPRCRRCRWCRRGPNPRGGAGSASAGWSATSAGRAGSPRPWRRRARRPSGRPGSCRASRSSASGTRAGCRRATRSSARLRRGSRRTGGPVDGLGERRRVGEDARRQGGDERVLQHEAVQHGCSLAGGDGVRPPSAHAVSARLQPADSVGLLSERREHDEAREQRSPDRRVERTEAVPGKRVEREGGARDAGDPGRERVQPCVGERGGPRTDRPCRCCAYPEVVNSWVCGLRRSRRMVPPIASPRISHASRPRVMSDS